jgi:hypothetical protein
MTRKEKVISAREQGKTYSQISLEFEVAESTARDWYNASLREGNSFIPIGHINENLKREASPKILKNLDAIEEFIGQLAPIFLPKPVRSIVEKTTSEYAMVIGDMHFPCHDNNTLEIFLETVRELQPSTIVLNGDTVDILAVSNYPKDIRHNYSLQDEREAYHDFLYSLLEVSGDAKIYETNANHSGNGHEGRWWRYLSQRLGELASLEDIREKLSYENVFLGQFQEDVETVDYVQLTEDFVILHGTEVRKHGGASARGHIDKYFVSLMHNHTHRFGFTAQRIPGIGDRPDKQIYGWENGCACSLNPIYANRPNWQNGFSIVGLDGENFSVEQVMVNDNRANIATLGKTMYV